jgi:hypothetical protein
MFLFHARSKWRSGPHHNADEGIEHYKEGFPDRRFAGKMVIFFDDFFRMMRILVTWRLPALAD